MGKVCGISSCKVNYTKQKRKIKSIPNKETVFSFPVKKSKPELYRKWVRFVNRESWQPTKNIGICAKHFDSMFINANCRKTLKWELNPVPSNRCEDLPQSELPTPETTRKPPIERNIQPDELPTFKSDDTLHNISDITDAFCPPGYKLELHDHAAIFYKLEFTNIAEVTETIVIDNNMHVKLYKKSVPIPLPEWFRKGSNCKLKYKSSLENFPAYIRNFTKGDSAEEIPSDILEELHHIRYKKPSEGPHFSPNLIRYALLLYYTSPQAYRMLLQKFPFPSVCYLKKLGQCGVEPLRACQLLLNEGHMDKDVVLLLDEIYIQKDVQYDAGKLIGLDKDGHLFKGIMTFMIVSLKKSIPFVIRATPETSIHGVWLTHEISSVITSVHDVGFQVRAVIADNHSTNVSAYKQLATKYGEPNKPNTIIHPSNSKRIYLFYDAVHLLKNIRNNLLNARSFIFPPFVFESFFDRINVPGGEISWKILHDVHDADLRIQGQLKKAPKLTNETLHPGNNKQSVPLALNIFDRSTAVAITEYFPERKDASEFLKLINIWWTISNSKKEKNSHFRIGNAAVEGDMKPLFLRNFADWVQKWQLLQCSRSQRYTLTAQTCHALVTTLRCTASLIEDLLREGYRYVLTARFQTDPLERRFSRYRQMSGGRFLISLKEAKTSEKIVAIASLLKEQVNFWEREIQPDNDHTEHLSNLNQQLDTNIDDIASCILDHNGEEVAAVVAGYAAKKLFHRNKCNACQNLCKASSEEIDHKENDYLNNLSRGGLFVPSDILRQYVSKNFAIIDVCHDIIRQSPLPERAAAEASISRNELSRAFLCQEHESQIWLINRIVVNVYFNNERKHLKGSVRKDEVKSFKDRQLKKQKLG